MKDLELETQTMEFTRHRGEFLVSNHEVIDA
jgi:hypothetical protein